MTEREIFFEALEMGTPEARAAYLQGACGQDVTLRRKVDELLKEHFSSDSLLAGPALEAERPGVAEFQAAEAPAQMIGRYKLLEKIGEGGFGEVWMAEQREPVKRRVALKIIKLGMDSRQIVARFEAERQALAMMDHPNIAKIFDAGVTETGRPYFVMELVRGIKITEYCDQNQLPTKERLDLFIKVGQAIQHAHQKGIIHRDIKPSNILVTLHDGVPVPKVIDFGIAKATQGELTDKTVFTQFQQFIGTPAYISPEQAEMSGLDIDTRADIYSLGVLLYELLVGQTPFDAKEMMQGGLDVLRQIIREKEPLRPSTRLNRLQGDARTTAAKRRQTDVGKLVHQLQGDLDWIVMKCLEKDRTRRYDTANGLAMDIQRHLANEPVTARPPSAAYKLQKAWQRNKVVFTAGAVVAVALLAGIGVSTWQAVVATQARGVAVHARKAAETARQEESALRVRAESAEQATEQQLYTALLEQARATVRSGELGQRVRTLDAVRRAAAMSNAVELRREAFAALALPDLRFELELPLAADVTLAVLDPKFERLAVGSGTNAVEIRSVPDQRLLATFPASASKLATFGKWSPDGRFLAIRRGRVLTRTREPTHVEVWEVASGRQVLSLPRTLGSAFSFHPSLPRILGSDLGDSVSVWDLETSRATAHFAVTGIVHHLEFSPDGQRFLAQHRIARPWFTSMFDTTTGEVRRRESNGWIDGMAWHPTGRWVALAARNGDIYVYDPKEGATDLLGRHQLEARTAAFSPDGDFLFTGGEEQEIISWDLRLRQRAFTIRSRSAQLQFDTEGLRCAVIERTRVLIHSLERSVSCRELTGDLGGIRHGAISPDGRWLAVAGAQGVGLWDLTRDGPSAVITESKNATPFFSPDGSELFAFWNDGFAHWRITAGPDPAGTPRLTALPIYKPGRIISAGFAADELVLGTPDGAIVVPGANIASGPGELFEIGTANARISPNGMWLAFRKRHPHYEQVYRLKPWDGMKFIEADAEVVAEAFTPGSDELAVATETSVTFLDTHRWERQRRFPVLLGRRTELIFFPDGASFWLVHDAGSAALHDTRTFETPLSLPTGMIPLAVSPDGVHLAVSLDGRRVQLWNMVEVRKQLSELGLDWGKERSDVRAPKR